MAPVATAIPFIALRTADSAKAAVVEPCLERKQPNSSEVDPVCSPMATSKDTEPVVVVMAAAVMAVVAMED